MVEARPCGHPPRAPDPPRRPDHAVHRQRYAAAAAVPARRRPPRGAPARRQPDLPARRRTSRRSATTGTRPSSRCSATGAWATTSSRSSCRRCGPSSPRRSGSTRTASTSRCFIGRPGARHPQGHRVAPRSGPSCSPRPASAPTRSSSTPRSTAPRSATGGARIAFYGKKNWWCRGGNAEDMPVGEPGGPDSELFYLYPAGRARPGLGGEVPPELRLRPLPRDRQLGVHGVPAHRDRLRAAPPQERRLRRRPRPHRRRVDGQPPTCSGSTCSGRSSRTCRTLTGKTLRGRRPSPMRVIADHLRGATFLAVDGVVPEQQGPGLRHAPAHPAGGPVSRSTSGSRRTSSRRSSRRSPACTTSDYPEVGENARRASSPCCQGGEGLPRRRCARASSSCAAYRKAGRVTGAELFTLYDTFGFPVELSHRGGAAGQGSPLSESWREEFDDAHGRSSGRGRRPRAS